MLCFHKAVADFNGDQIPDLIWQNTFSTGTTVGLITFSFTQLSQTTAWVLPPGGPFPFEAAFTTQAGPGGSINAGVPAPGAGVILTICALVATRSRRR